MAIKEKQNEFGKTVFDVYVNMQSSVNKSIRKQKRKNGITTKAKALRVQEQLYQSAAKEIHTAENKDKLWGEIVNKWYDSEANNLESPMSPSTLADNYSALKTWTRSIWDIPGPEINKTDVSKIVRNLDSQGRTKKFQHKIKQLISRILTWGKENRLLKNFDDPTTGIKISIKTEKLPEILTKSQVIKFLNAAKRLDHPWYPVWAFALTTGCRSGEIRAVSWDDVSFENDTIRINKSFHTRTGVTKTTKNGKWRNIPINSELKALLIEMKNRQNESDTIFESLPGWDQNKQAEILRTFLRGIGLPSVRFHTLRACFATMLLQQNIAPATVMKIGGWSDMKTMNIYVRLAGIEESGATDDLRILPIKDPEHKILTLYSDKK